MKLTNNELEIMELMWNMNKPLSRSEIIELSPNRSWKSNSIHILLNKMLDKNVIKVDGFTRTGKNYGRTYSPVITQEEYLLMNFEQSYAFTKQKSLAITSLFSALLNDSDIDDKVIGELEQMIEERKHKEKE